MRVSQSRFLCTRSRKGQFSRYLACTQVRYGHESARPCPDRRPARLEGSRSEFALSRCASASGGRGGRIVSRWGGRAIPRTGDRTVGPAGSLRDWLSAVAAR